MILTLGIAYWAVSVLTAVFLLVCIVLILTVLIQRPQGGGLSGAFGAGGGGAGAGQTAFGAKTGDALTMATIIMFVVYLGVAVGLNFAARPQSIAATTPGIQAPGGDAGQSGAASTGAGEADDDTAEPDAGEDAQVPTEQTPSDDAPADDAEPTGEGAGEQAGEQGEAAPPVVTDDP